MSQDLGDSGPLPRDADDGRCKLCATHWTTYRLEVVREYGYGWEVAGLLAKRALNHQKRHGRKV